MVFRFTPAAASAPGPPLPAAAAPGTARYGCPESPRCLFAAMSSGAPTTRPPSAPPSGPMSITPVDHPVGGLDDLQIVLGEIGRGDDPCQQPAALPLQPTQHGGHAQPERTAVARSFRRPSTDAAPLSGKSAKEGRVIGCRPPTKAATRVRSRPAVFPPFTRIRPRSP